MTMEAQTLIDSNALVCFMDKELVQQYTLGYSRKEHISADWGHWWSKPFIRTIDSWNQAIKCYQWFPRQ
jgi:hypothetical protein